VNTINAEVIKIYSKYFIIDDVFAESKILELIGEINRNGTKNNRKISINAEISRILQPFQKKFMGMLMHKNIRHKSELNVSTQINKEVSNKSFGPLRPFFPITVRGNRNVLDEIITFYKTEKVGTYKKKIVRQVREDYGRNNKVFFEICKKYLKMNDEQSIKFYDSYWKIMVDIYGNLNIVYAQSDKSTIYISLFYKYDKLNFFKNIYLITSLMYQFGNHNEFFYFLEDIYLSSQHFSQNQKSNYDDPMIDTYTKIKNILSLGPAGSAGSIIDFIFSFIQFGNLDINDIKEDIENIFYYLLNYNDEFILEYYKNYGTICLFFLKDLPNYIIYDDYTKNQQLMNDYPESSNEHIYYKKIIKFPDICKMKNIEYIVKLSKDKKQYEEKSKYIIKEYLPKYFKYFNENKEKHLKSVKNNKNINKIMKFNETNKKGIFTNGSQNVSNDQHEKPADSVVINKATQLLTQGVYFAT
jgi:hypothetical protein